MNSTSVLLLVHAQAKEEYFDEKMRNLQAQQVKDSYGGQHQMRDDIHSCER